MALAGHDVGGTVAQIEAYSYKNVDALMVLGIADQGFTPFVTDLAARASAR